MEKSIMSLRELTDVLTIRDEILQQKIEQARINEELFRNIFNLVPNPIIVTNAVTGLIEHVNKAFEESTGYAECEILGKPSLVLYANPEDRNVIIDIVKRKGEAKDISIEILHKTGKSMECILLVKPITKEKLSVFLGIIERIGHRRSTDKPLEEIKND